MHENPRLNTVKLKNISKQEVSYLLLHFGLYLKKEWNLSKKGFFIDLGIHFNLRKNESFVVKARFFTRKNQETVNFIQIEYLHNKTKMSFIVFVDKKSLSFIAQLSLFLGQTLLI